MFIESLLHAAVENLEVKTVFEPEVLMVWWLIDKSDKDLIYRVCLGYRG